MIAANSMIIHIRRTMAMLGILTAAIFVIVVGIAPGSIINLLSAFI